MIINDTRSFNNCILCLHGLSLFNVKMSLITFQCDNYTKIEMVRKMGLERQTFNSQSITPLNVNQL